MKIIKLTYLAKRDIKELLTESQEEGFFFFTKLVAEYKNRQNVFNKTGERLWGVYGEQNKLIGVAGLNQNSYSQYANAGRVRRFYVSAQFRIKGIGKRLLKAVIHYAENSYDSLVLYTDTDEAKLFYERNGFKRVYNQHKITHEYKLKNVH
ncbi:MULTISPECIES: GNAT family N-acetyltransferase [Priestia]|jgi:GNAT superfamily N-acetyltransferase|uniref:GNAT family N-acetyltransferase n=1 Tax=Priestia TaxID=2800373 RepID=UPI0006FE63E4|nr:MULTISPECIES: GNAT family N-acetyltransferase [Priestia]KQU11849.1 GNAT family acetyltransferase [Bacillus sp. Leaf75]MDH6654183.1 GNAT superfamily N-acetyltransferase [Bacillus sp. PvP124]MDP9575699.1 GNAT superfamily N-acetyltransferase [Bacillus sp. 1751]KAA8749368.1 GNAT family N-acetyltransferase [Priestia megaterium]MBD8111723.1 GNAT family N-acetyltransferase [Priestia megaterium]